MHASRGARLNEKREREKNEGETKGESRRGSSGFEGVTASMGIDILLKSTRQGKAGSLLGKKDWKLISR